MTVYSDQMRNDPARKAAVKERDEEIQAAFSNAHDLLRQAQAAFAAAGHIDPHEDALAARCQSALWHALHQFDGDARFIMAETNDTALGNRAARGLPLGWESEGS